MPATGSENQRIPMTFHATIPLVIVDIAIDRTIALGYLLSIKVSCGHNWESCENQERARRCNRGQPLQMPLTEVGKAQLEERSGKSEDLP